MNNNLSKEEIVQLIEERIVSEYRKHKNLNWAKIASIKIYSSLFTKNNNNNDKRITKQIS